MLELLWLIPALPFAGFMVLALLGHRLGRAAVGLVGAGSVGAAAAVNLMVAAEFLLHPPGGKAFSQTLWTWIQVEGFQPEITLLLDGLSVVMTLVITGVGFLIHLYATEYMEGDEGYARFFAYLNLFVGSMLVLVLADDLLVLYLGWEGVGLCSYLLIGFWYRDPKNGAAARKAFVVTRVGDIALAVALLLIFTELGTLQIQPALEEAARQWPVGSGLAVAVALLVLGGAVGKSAQLPLQTWLPDAMAGPTPVSALIHAATMVTAGFYLIARTHGLFALAPAAQTAVAWVGAITLLLGGLSALAQRDIKRALAYSTISQIGYLFLALGAGAYMAAVFHFMTHAFFKALLFLGAGAVILALHHEQDLLQMGGLRKRLPVTFWTFLVGAASLAALPWVTAGFYSKDLILERVWSSPSGGPVLWALGLAGAFVTGVYAFRLVFLTFFGEAKIEVRRRPRMPMRIVLVVLAALSVLGGLLDPSKLLAAVLPPVASTDDHANRALLVLVASALSVGGAMLAYLLFGRKSRAIEIWRASRPGKAVSRFCSRGFGFDWLYDRAVVRPFGLLAQINRSDFIDAFYRGLARLVDILHQAMGLTQTGRVRHYVAGIALGAALLLALVWVSWS